MFGGLYIGLMYYGWMEMKLVWLGHRIKSMTKRHCADDRIVQTFSFEGQSRADMTCSRKSDNGQLGK